MKSVQKAIIGLIRGMGFLLLFPAVAFAAPRLYLDPATVSVVAGSTATVNLLIDSDVQTATAADAKITFPKALLESSTVTTGTFFDSITKMVSNLTGTIEIHGYFSGASTTQSKSGKGTVAVLTFKGLAPGVATLALPCTDGTTTDANIADTTGKDIIVCTDVSGSEITVTQAGNGSTLKPTPVPSVLPTAGVEFPTIGLLLIGLTMFGGGSFILMRKAV